MFHIFSKNEFIADKLEGFVDIHNHILPGIDDGAANVKESILLIKSFMELGVTDFICTPHIMSGYYENTKETIKSAYHHLVDELPKHNLNSIQIRYAAEHMVDSNIEQLLKTNAHLCLDEQHLLIEMSYLQPSINFSTTIDLILEKQLFPVFAHPERYVYLHGDLKKYEHYRQSGLKFQLNLLSIFGYYGKGIQKVALQLLKAGYYDFVATDTHGMRHLNVLKSQKIRQQHMHQLMGLLENTKEQFKNTV